MMLVVVIGVAGAMSIVCKKGIIGKHFRQNEYSHSFSRTRDSFVEGSEDVVRLRKVCVFFACWYGTIYR